ncbi:hypothetical protein [Roseateles sp.]|uniref:hypothetical protein n=1 Tax=Roseateles sp. TaxID=1971397 RepID=UPI0032662AE4
MRLGIFSLVLLWPLVACNGASDATAAAPAPSKAAVVRPGETLRIVRRVHPDPAWMREHLEGRLDMCMAMLRANGQEGAPRPPLPSAAEIASWVTVEQEEIYAGEQAANFSTLALVWPDQTKGCRLMLFKQLSAKTETLCGASYAGSARAGTPGEQGTTSDAKAPNFSGEQLEGGPEGAKQCRTDASKKRDTSDLAQGVTRGGHRCYWVGMDGTPGTGPVEPRERGVHACVHPRYFDGTLPQGKDGLTLRSVRVFGPGEKVNDHLKFGMPESDAMRMEAEVVEDGQAIAPSRFSHEAVEAYVRQPLVVPAQGDNHANK